MVGRLRGGANERLSRSLAKTGIYRLLMVAITLLVALVVTGDAMDSAGIALGANVVKTGTYFGYERLWARIDWGTAMA